MPAEGSGDPDGKLVDNPLSILNRWKILDNLRRSLVPAGLIAFLLASWFTTPGMALVAGATVGFMLLFPVAVQVAHLLDHLALAGRFVLA